MDQKKDIKRIIFVVLGLCGFLLPIVILVWVLFFKIFSPSPAKVPSPIYNIGQISKKIQAQRQDAVGSDERLIPDPFMPPVEKQRKKTEFVMSAPKNLSLQGIIYQKGKAAAIINDIIVREGDIISEKRILEISDNRVVLTDADYHTGYQYILNFREE